MISIYPYINIIHLLLCILIDKSIDMDIWICRLEKEASSIRINMKRLDLLHKQIMLLEENKEVKK